MHPHEAGKNDQTDNPVLRGKSMSDMKPFMTRRWWVVTLLFLGVLINYIDRGNLSIAAVPIMRDLRLSPTEIGVLLSAFFWTYPLFQIPAGYLVDASGLKWSYGIAFLIWSLASAAVALVHSFSQIISLRLLLGMSEAVVGPASLAYIKQRFSEEEQGLPTALYVSGMMLGPAIGALAGGILLQSVGWRALFLATGLVACFWLWPWLRLAPGKDEKKCDPVAKAAPPKRHHNWLRLLLSPVTWGITASAFSYSYFWYFCLTWLPSYLLMSRHFSYSRMGTFMALPLVAMAVSTVIFGRFADGLAKRSDPLTVRRSFVIIGFVAGSSIVLLVVAKSQAQVMGVLIASLIAVGLAGANYWAITEIISPRAMIGRFVGFQNTVAQIGGACAPIVTGVLVSNTGNFRLAVGLAGLSLLIAAGAILALIRDRSVKQFCSLVDDAPSLVN